MILNDLDALVTEMADKLPIAVYICQDGRFLWANARFVKNIGYPAESIPGMSCLSPVHPDDREKVRENAVAMLRGERSSPYEYRAVARDGSVLWVMESVESVRLRGGRAVLGSQMDISKQKEADEILGERQKRIEEAYHMAHMGAWSWDRETKVLVWSDEIYEMLGLDKSHQPTIEDHARLYAPGYWEGRVKANRRLLETGEPFQMEAEMIRADGERIWVSTYAGPRYNTAGEIIGVYATLQDITEQKRAEESLRENQRRIEEAYRMAHMGAWSWTKETNAAIWSVEIYEMFGLDPHKPIPAVDELKRFYGPNEWKARLEAGFRVMEKGEVYRLEQEITRADGTKRWIDSIGGPKYDVEGKIIGIQGTVQDITERKIAEIALKASEERYRTIVESIPDPYSEIDLTGIITYVNQAFLKDTGYSREELLGTNFRKLVDDRNAELATLVYREVFETGNSARNLELEWKAKDDQIKLSEVSVSPIWDINGQAIGFQSIYHDVTQRRRMEEATLRAKEAAEAASNAKSEFLASMSHEIRTPMNAILGMAELLVETPLTREQMKYVQVFREAGENLLNIINDILDLSKVEAGHIRLEHIDFDLRELVERIGDIMSVRAGKKGLELTCHIAPDVPAYFRGDPVRLRQVIVNLLGNAVKFTEQGEVILDIKRTSPATGEDGDARVELTFSVCDTGIGIPPEKMQDVFDRFTQADSSTTRKYGGTGLGLTISKSLVELMGGTIKVKSDVAKGSIFSFSIPFEVRRGTGIEEEPVFTDITGRRAIVIDDNATNRLILREMLTGWGAVVTSADSGSSGIAALKEALSLKMPYDFILLDYHMPMMDGFSAAQEIRKDAGLALTPIIMVSSGYPDENLTEAKKIGIDQFLFKPVKRRDLREAISAALGKVQMAQTMPVAEKSATDAGPSLSILLVEDNEDNRLLIRTFLKSTPHRLQTAENGAVGVETFKTGSYDIVLMDMQMPVMDGYEATREIRRWEQKEGRAATPIVALTAYALREDEKKSLDAGCNGHLTKPIKKANLISALADYSKRNS